MPTTTVKSVIDSVKNTLVETSVNGSYWTNEELMRYLNESYQDIVRLAPEVNSQTDDFMCVAGTKQSVPANGIRLLDVVRNLAPSKRVIKNVPRKQLDLSDPDWHESVVGENDPIEQFTFDEVNPKVFYIYPGAIGAQNTLEIVYSAMLESHAVVGDTIPNELIKLEDIHAPLMINYILYRAFIKDTDSSDGVNRASAHYKLYSDGLLGRQQVDYVVSPAQREV